MALLRRSGPSAPRAAVHTGTAELRPGRAYDVVRAWEPDVPDDVRVLHVPVLRSRLQRAHRGADRWRTPLPPWGMRLSRALRAQRAGRGDVPLVVAWSDDGRTCRLLQVEPPT